MKRLLQTFKSSRFLNTDNKRGKKFDDEEFLERNNIRADIFVFQTARDTMQKSYDRRQTIDIQVMVS